jgi:hypothetical protein
MLPQLQRILSVVDKLTKEKDAANRRLKAVKRALSSESLILSARNSIVYPIHYAADAPVKAP